MDTGSRLDAREHGTRLSDGAGPRILVLGKRIGWQKEGGAGRPHNLPLVMLGRLLVE